jgi:hypothetical protein
MSQITGYSYEFVPIGIEKSRYKVIFLKCSCNGNVCDVNSTTST